MEAEISTSSDIHEAVRTNRLQDVETLLRAGVCVNTINEEGQTLLHTVAESSNIVNTSLRSEIADTKLDIVHLLIKERANVNAEDNKGRTPLHYAAAAGNNKIVEILLANNAVINATEEAGNTALHLAINCNHPDIVETLLKEGADVNAKNDTNSTPMHNAVAQGNCEIVEKLIRFGANVNSIDRTPLHLACGKGHLELVSMLINYGADLEMKTDRCLIDDNELGIERNEPIEATALNFAVWFNQPRVVEVLVNAGVNIDATDVCGFSSLHTASMLNNCKMINVLILFGAKINGKGIQGTPLHEAVFNENIQAVKTLIKLGADIQGKDVTGQTPLHRATTNKTLDIVNILLYNGAKIDSTDKYGLTPFHVAAKEGNIKVMKLLLKRGANINAVSGLESKDDGFFSPLYLAVSNNHIDAVKLLIQAGADASIRDKKGHNLLHLAATVGGPHIGITAFILKFCDDDIDCRDFSGKTPLHIASLNAKPEVVSLLIRSGADINAICQESLSALDYARKITRYDQRLAAKSCWSFLMLHVLLLKSVNMKLCEKLLKGKDVNIFYDIMTKTNFPNELAKLKKTRIGNSNVTFYNLLGKNIRRLAVTLNSDAIKDALSMASHKDFPNYHSIILNHYRKGLQRKTIVDSAILTWYEHFPSLPYDCICEIFSYFSCQELKTFTNGFRKD